MKKRPMLWALGLYLFSHTVVFAQEDGLVYHTVKIKFKAEAGAILKSNVANFAADVVVPRTGLAEVDVLYDHYLVDRMERLFPSNARFSKRQEAAGLHLWYRLRVYLRKGETIESSLNSFSANEWIAVAEEEKGKFLVDQYPEVHQPKWQAEEAADFPDDPFFRSNPEAYYDIYQWHFQNTDQPHADVDLLSAWTVETGSPDVVVAVMDLEVQPDHYDLDGNIWVNSIERNGVPGVDDDNNGYIDDVNGYNFVSETGELKGEDHGTHVAGTIAARNNNGLGVASIAGGMGDDTGVKIMSCAIISGGLFGELKGVEEAFIYAADHGAVIAQNSWGYLAADEFEQSVKDAIDYFIAYAGQDENGIQTGPMKGGIVIFSAGNDDSDAPKYPAAYEKVMAVASTDSKDLKSDFSNYGDWVDISAPGSAVVSTMAEHSTSPYQMGDGVGVLWGTSMACPHVSGVAALMVSKFGGPDFTPDQVWDRLTQTTEDLDLFNPDYSGTLGTGRLNAYQALTADDGLAPDPVTDLVISDQTFKSLTLSWTAMGESGDVGKAHHYDLRYSTAPITEANFEAATRVLNVPRPAWAGETDSTVITGLSPHTTYYLALRSIDANGEASALSTVLEGKTSRPPVLTLPVTELNVNLNREESHDEVFCISNAQGYASLSYEVQLPVTQPGQFEFNNLENTLFALNEQYERLTDQIPKTYEWSRVNKNNISDGNIYDFLEGGNFLSTSLGFGISYADNEVQEEQAFGAGSQYFTQSFPGLFVLGADLNGISYFEISGKLERNYQYDDLPGLVDGTVLTIESHGRVYKGFVKRVFEKRSEYHGDSYEPSLNHLVIVESAGDLTHSFSNDSENDYHRVSGLQNSQRLYYLVFGNDHAHEKGWGWMSDDLLKDMMRSFVAIVDEAWLSIDQPQESIEAGQEQRLYLSARSTSLPVGVHKKEVTITSNDPALPETSFLVTLTVGNKVPGFTTTIDDQLLRTLDDAVLIDLAEISEDPEGDQLSYTATAENPNVTKVVIEGHWLSLMPESAGITTVSVGLNDGYDTGSTITFQVEVLDPVTAIEEGSGDDLNFKAYPNPVEQALQLSYQSQSPKDFLKLEIFDTQGRVCYRWTDMPERPEIGNFVWQVDTSDWPSGMYYCKLQTKGATRALKIIK